jgi:hypothetical protein
MKIRKNIAISDSGFIFNPTSGDSFSTNPIGLEIIRMFKSGKDRAEVKKTIMKTYGVDESTFEKDLYDFLMMLQSNQIGEE